MFSWHLRVFRHFTNNVVTKTPKDITLNPSCFRGTSPWTRHQRPDAMFETLLSSIEIHCYPNRDFIPTRRAENCCTPSSIFNNIHRWYYDNVTWHRTLQSRWTTTSVLQFHLPASYYCKYIPTFLPLTTSSHFFFRRLLNLIMKTMKFPSWSKTKSLSPKPQQQTPPKASQRAPQSAPVAKGILRNGKGAKRYGKATIGVLLLSHAQEVKQKREYLNFERRSPLAPSTRCL